MTSRQQVPGRLRVYALAFLQAVTALAVIAAILGFFGRWGWWFELASHFRVQYGLFFGLAGLLFWAARRFGEGLLCGLMASLHLVLLVPFYFETPRVQAAGDSLRALQLNVKASNRAYDRVLDLVETVRPDLVVMEEITGTWARRLAPLDRQFPNRLFHPREDYTGIAIFSRFAFEDARVVFPGEGASPAILARLDVNGRALTVVGAHPPPPVSPARARARNHQLGELARLLSEQTGPVIVLGDLNTTSWSWVFSEFLRTADLLDSRVGRGIQPTWPSRVPLLWIPIDHILVSPDITVLRRWVGPDVGSDHRPVVIDFSLPPDRR